MAVGELGPTRSWEYQEIISFLKNMGLLKNAIKGGNFT